MELRKISLFGMHIDAISMDEAVCQLIYWVEQPFDKCNFVVTPNVNHSVMLQHHEGMREAYRQADLVVTDGMPVVWVSRLLGKPVPERVAGSELVTALFDAAHHVGHLRVFLLGAAPNVSSRAAVNIQAQWPAVQVVGTCSPPIGFERDAKQNGEILQAIAAADADVVVVGLGAPKQELWVCRHRDDLRAKVALCVGGTIDYLSGYKSQAPVWMRRAGLEWCHRVVTEPRRLGGRYARDAMSFPLLVWREWRTGSSTSQGTHSFTR